MVAVCSWLCTVATCVAAGVAVVVAGVTVVIAAGVAETVAGASVMVAISNA